MGPIAKEIKKTYDMWVWNKKDYKYGRHGEICRLDPFEENHWYYTYLFPEILIVFEDYVENEYNQAYSAYSVEEFRYYTYRMPNNEARIFPCWVCSEEQVLRIMSEVIGI